MNILSELLMKNTEIPARLHAPYIEINHREIERVATHAADVYALMSWGGSHGFIFPVQLIDINRKGCGIYYVTEKLPLNVLDSHEKCDLKFVSLAKMFELADNKVIYDFEIAAYSTERISVRRCGIRFNEFVRVKKWD